MRWSGYPPEWIAKELRRAAESWELKGHPKDFERLTRESIGSDLTGVYATYARFNVTVDSWPIRALTAYVRRKGGTPLHIVELETWVNAIFGEHAGKAWRVEVLDRQNRPYHRIMVFCGLRWEPIDYVATNPFPTAEPWPRYLQEQKEKNAKRAENDPAGRSDDPAGDPVQSQGRPESDC